MMSGIEFLAFGLSRMGCLEFEHRHLRDKRLQLLADILRGPVADCCV